MTSGARAQGQRDWAKGLVGIVLAIVFGVLFRLYRLGDEAYWVDELYFQAALDRSDSVFGYYSLLRRIDPISQPLYFVLVYYWHHYVAAPESGVLAALAPLVRMRLMSVALGVVTMGCTGLAARRFFGPAAGVVATVLVALSPGHIYFSQEVRMYPLVLAGAAVSLWSFAHIAHGGRREWYLLNVLANGIMLLSHFFAAFWIVAIGSILLARSRFAMVAYWAAGHLPWMLLTGYHISQMDHEHAREMGAATPTNWMGVSAIMPFLFGLDGRYGAFPFALVATYIGLFGLLAAVALARARYRPRETKLAAFAALGVLGLVPVFLLLAFDAWLRPAFLFRYVLYTTLPLFVILSAVATYPASTFTRWSAAALLVLSATVSGLSIPRPFRPPIPALVAAFASTDLRRPATILWTFPGDIVVHHHYGFAQFGMGPNFYRRPPHAYYPAIAFARDGYEVWLVCYDAKVQDGLLPLPHHFEREGLHVEEQVFEGFVHMRLLRITAATDSGAQHRPEEE